MSANIEDIYQALINAGLDEEAINNQVNEKYNEFQGFMSKQAILYLLAKEYGLEIASSSNNEHFDYEIDYNDFAIPIAEITETMSNIVITGRILRNFGIKEFVRKDGSPGIVGSFVIGDASGAIKIVLWNDHIKVMENEYFQVGEIVQVIGGYSKLGLETEIEVHLSKIGKIILSPKNAEVSQLPDVDSFTETKSQKRTSSPKFSLGDLYDMEGLIKSITGTIRIEEFRELLKKNGEKTFLLKLILSDETSSIRVLVWGMNAVESLKILSDGDSVQLSNVLIKENAYTNEKELIFTKKSSLREILQDGKVNSESDF